MTNITPNLGLDEVSIVDLDLPNQSNTTFSSHIEYSNFIYRTICRRLYSLPPASCAPHACDRGQVLGGWRRRVPERRAYGLAALGIQPGQLVVHQPRRADSQAR